VGNGIRGSGDEEKRCRQKKRDGGVKVKGRGTKFLYRRTLPDKKTFKSDEGRN